MPYTCGYNSAVAEQELPGPMPQAVDPKLQAATQTFCAEQLNGTSTINIWPEAAEWRWGHRGCHVPLKTQRWGHKEVANSVSPLLFSKMFRSTLGSGDTEDATSLGNHRAGDTKRWEPLCPHFCFLRYFAEHTEVGTQRTRLFENTKGADTKMWQPLCPHLCLLIYF